MCEHLGSGDFCRWLDQAHRQKVCHYVRQKYVSLSEPDIDDVWSETVKALLQKWPRGEVFSSQESFDGLLFTIADRRACDTVRRAEARGRLLRKCRNRVRNDAGPDGESAVSQNRDPLIFQELQEHVIEAFTQLNDDQWMVLAVYCDEYPKLRGPTRLFKALTELFPEVVEWGWDPTTVRKLLDQARAKVRKYLCDKGYDGDFKS